MIRLPRRLTLIAVALLISLTVTACSDDSTPSEPTGVAASTATTSVSQSDARTPTTSTGNDQSGSSSSGAATATPPAEQPPRTPAPSLTSTPLTLPTPRTVEQTPPPVRLRIPALGIDSAVQWVGVDAEGRMAVPSNYTEVAWYEQGPAPGTPGNAVIAGHLDSTTGPAVFYNLEDLKPGDEIITTTADGQEFRFVVTTSEVYNADDAPLDRIFGTAIRPQLNLITCDGAFDRSVREYDKRLVVYTELAGGS